MSTSSIRPPPISRAAKLTFEKVKELRHLYFNCGWTQAALSRHYQISIGQVGRIVRGESWQNETALPEPLLPPISPENCKEAIQQLKETIAAVDSPLPSLAEPPKLFPEPATVEVIPETQRTWLLKLKSEIESGLEGNKLVDELFNDKEQIENED